MQNRFHRFLAHPNFIFTVALIFFIALGGARQTLADAPELKTPIAIKNITIIPAPGEKIEAGLIVLENGRIVAAGKSADVKIPPGARELDGGGLFAYAGFLDAFTRVGIDDPKPSAEQERRVEDEYPSTAEGPQAKTVDANRAGIHAHRQVEDLLNIKEDTFKNARQAGFTAALAAPPTAVLGGQASVILLGDRPLRRSVLKSDFAQTASFQPPGRRALEDRGRYPSTTFGVIAHFRQTLSDAAWYRDMLAYGKRHPEARGETPFDLDLEALQAVLQGQQPLLWEANRADEIHRVLNLADEIHFRPVLVGGRDAWQANDRLKATKTPVLISLNLPPKPKTYKLDPKSVRKAADDATIYGKDWLKRPFEPKAAYEEAKRQREERLRNAAKLEEAGIVWCFTGQDLKAPADMFKNLRELHKAGLSVEALVRALTVTPATLFGLDKELGTVQAGKRANLTILTKPLGDQDAKVRWVFIDGREYEFEGPAAKKGDKGDKEKSERGAGRGPGPGRPDSQKGGEDEEGEEEDKEEKDEVTASQPASEPTVAASQKSSEPGPLDDLLLNEPNWVLETDRDREPGIRTGGNVLLKNATVLTITNGDLPNTSVLVQNGKIAAIGKDLQAPPGVKTIDLAGYVIMPGILDPHSHIALDSINEGALSVVPEVRCEDVVAHDDESIYRAAAGGVTTIHAMHGSANTIGGQCVILKMKYGLPAADLIVRDRHRTVKFALGENVKRPGMSDRPRWAGNSPRRFPGTRMGVEATVRRAFSEGQRYLEEQAAHQKAVQAGQEVKPLRRDLRLQALADILSGDIWINSHCYRSDEILRLLAVCEEFGVRVATLHHVLEGYRIMPEIARHGCGASTFSDWWAYKIEAYDAVPQNAGLMLKYGINATINSDSEDMMRRLNIEAAKCMKFAGLTPNEALCLITINGARHFGLEKRLGSIEVGKDGDIAVFDGHPLDTFSHCVLTLIEGEVYFRHPAFKPESPSQPSCPPRTFARMEMMDGKNTLAVTSPKIVSTNGSNGTDGAKATNGHGQSNAYAIINATVHPVSRAPIAGGMVLIQNGKIAAVGQGLTLPPDATVIDAKGLHVYPGLINAGTEVGLHEIDQVEVTVDTGDSGTYQPDLMAVSAMNPHSATVDVTRAEGITTVLALPRGPTVSGQAGLLNLDGWTMPEMLIDPKVGLVISLPSAPAKPILETPQRRSAMEEDEEDEEDEPPRRGRGQQDEQINKALKELETFFRDAKLYAKATVEAREKKLPPPLASDPRFEAMIPYALAQKPVIFRANGYKQILEALLFAEHLELKPIIFGGQDAWKLAGALAKRNVPIIYDGVFAGPRGVPALHNVSDAWDANYRALSVMQKAGVKFCVAQLSSALAKTMPVETGFAVGHGLDPDAAVRAMTLSAAEILGVEKELGSLDPGKIANVIITTDHPCQACNVVKYAFVRGRPIALESRHTQEAVKFAERPAPQLPPARTDLKGSPSQTLPASKTAQK